MSDDMTGTRATITVEDARIPDGAVTYTAQAASLRTATPPDIETMLPELLECATRGVTRHVRGLKAETV